MKRENNMTTEYRYVTYRNLQGNYTRDNQPAYQSALFVMLSPEKSSGSEDTAIIKKCLKFCDRLKIREMSIVYLFGAQVDNTDELWTLDDPVGPENDRVTHEFSEVADLVIAGWGSNKEALPRVQELLPDLMRHVPIHSFGITKDGYPKSLMNVKADADLVEYAAMPQDYEQMQEDGHRPMPPLHDPEQPLQSIEVQPDPVEPAPEQTAATAEQTDPPTEAQGE